MGFGFGNLDLMRQRLSAVPQTWDVDYTNGVSPTKPALPSAAPNQPAADPNVPASTVDQVNTGLPKLTPPTDGGGSSLSSIFSALFGA